MMGCEEESDGAIKGKYVRVGYLLDDVVIVLRMELDNFFCRKMQL